MLYGPELDCLVSVTTVTSGNTENAILTSLFFILFNSTEGHMAVYERSIYCHMTRSDMKTQFLLNCDVYFITSTDVCRRKGIFNYYIK
jgi:hypothetical protein